MAPKRFNFTEQTIDDGACLICTNVKRHAPSCSPLSLLGNSRPIRKTLEDFLKLKCTSRLLVNFELSKRIIKCGIKTLSYVILEDIFFCRFGRTHSMHRAYIIYIMFKFWLTKTLDRINHKSIECHTWIRNLLNF